MPFCPVMLNLGPGVVLHHRLSFMAQNLSQEGVRWWLAVHISMTSPPASAARLVVFSSSSALTLSSNAHQYLAVHSTL